MNKLKLTLAISALSVVLLFYIFCVNHVNPNQYGVAYNKADGQISQQAIGWHITAPWVKATTISDLPTVIDVSQTGYSSSRLRFVPKFIKLRIKKEYIEDFFADTGFQYICDSEQESYMKAAYFQDVKPRWLEILE